MSIHELNLKLTPSHVEKAIGADTLSERDKKREISDTAETTLCQDANEKGLEFNSSFGPKLSPSTSCQRKNSTGLYINRSKLFKVKQERRNAPSNTPSNTLSNTPTDAPVQPRFTAFHTFRLSSKRSKKERGTNRGETVTDGDGLQSFADPGSVKKTSVYSHTEICEEALSTNASSESADASPEDVEETSKPEKKEQAIHPLQEQHDNWLPDEGKTEAGLSIAFSKTQQTTDSERQEQCPETDLKHLSNPSGGMLSHSLVSVLGPHWSGRLRTHKQGVTGIGVNGIYEQTLESRQSNSLAAFRSQQDPKQQSFSSQRQQGGDVFLEPNKQEKSSFPRTSRSVVVLQTREASNRKETDSSFLAKSPKSVSFDVNCEKNDNNTEFSTYVTSPQDTMQSPRSPLSLDLGRYRRMSQSSSQGEPFSPLSSKPTTSSLLLSLRTSSRKIQLQPQSPTPSGSPMLPRWGIRKVSQPSSAPMSPNNNNAETFASERPMDVSASPTSPRYVEPNTSRPSLFLASKSNMKQVSSTSREQCGARDGTVGTLSIKERRFPNVSSRLSHLEALKVSPQGPAFSFSNRHSPSNPSKANIDILAPDNTANNRSANMTEMPVNNRFRGVVLNQGSMHAQTTNEKSDSSTPIIHTNLNTSRNLNFCKSISENSQDQANAVNVPNLTLSPKTCRAPLSVHQFHSVPNKTQSPQNLADTSTFSFGEPPAIRTNSLNNRTFTDNLTFSPKKVPHVEGTSPSPVLKDCVNLRTGSKSVNSPMEQTGPVSPSSPVRSIHAPRIYSFLRPASPTTVTPMSPASNSASPDTQHIETQHFLPKHGGGSVPGEDNKTYSSRFIFDFSPKPWTRNSCSTSAPQSPPPDLGTRSMQRVSTSPYSTLISARASLKSPPQGTSPAISPQSNNSISPDTIKDHRTASHPTSMVQRSSVEQVNSADNLIAMTAETGSSAFQENYEVFQTSHPHNNRIGSAFLQNKVSCFTPDCSQSQQREESIETFSQQTHARITSPQDVRSNNDIVWGLNKTKVSEPASEPKATIKSSIAKETQKIHGRSFLAPPSLNLKRSIFTFESKKDSQPAPAAGKEVVNNSFTKTTKDSTVLKSSNKIDQVINRIRQTFRVKRSEEEPLTCRKDVGPSQQSSAGKTSIGRREDSCCENNEMPKPIQPINTAESNLFSSQHGRNTTSMTTKSIQSEGSRFWGRQNAFDENGNSPHSNDPDPSPPKPHYSNRSATIPHYRKTSAKYSAPHFSRTFDAADIENENVFYGTIPVRRRTISLSESKDIHQGSSVEDSGTPGLESKWVSCADLKYGLERGRCFSVSSVVSSRPSGLGRISTGSRTNSVSDLSSPYEPMSCHRSNTDDCIDSPVFVPRAATSPGSYAGQTRGAQTSRHHWSPGSLEISVLHWDEKEEPTLPSSPPFSPASRRISRVPCSPSTGSWTSQDSLSPRGHLPSRNYKSSLSIFEESSSDTTTDDEYYLDEDDEKETEL